MMKVAIIGANHAGLATTRQLLQSKKDVEITLIDRRKQVGYISGGTPLLLGNKIRTYKEFFYSDLDEIKENVAHFYESSEVIGIDFKEKKILLRDQLHKKSTLKYDKLVLATGSRQQRLGIENSELAGIQLLKDLDDALFLNQKLDNLSVKNIAIIGGGYLGVEVAEALSLRNKNVRLFEIQPEILNSHYDKSFSEIAQQHLAEHGIELHLDEEVTRFEGSGGKVTAVVTMQGYYRADIVVLATGFTPNTDLGHFHLDHYTNGAYLVDKQQRTSDPDVYAVGDCATFYSCATEDQRSDFSVANALRSGYIAAQSILEKPLPATGSVTISAIKIFDLNLFSTGITIKRAHLYNIEAEYVESSKVTLLSMLGKKEEIKLRIIYHKKDRRILGGQICAHSDLTEMILRLALAIQNKMTIDDLKYSQTFFYPYFTYLSDPLIDLAKTSDSKKEHN